MVYELTIFVAGIIAIAFAVYLALNVVKQETGTPEMRQISEAIRMGSAAYLKRQYSTITIISAILAIILCLVSNYRISIAFIFGVVSSLLAGFIGMNVAVKANVRAANAARTSLNKALRVAFNSGMVTGMSVIGLGLLGISILYVIYGNANVYDLVGLGFGASLTALFCRVGGGIYTKTADVGADLVGKIEAGIPEDDPRNPAVIADLVGDNVGDVAGMSSDLFESYVASTIAAIVVGYVYLGTPGILLPLLIRALGIFTSMLGFVFVHLKCGKDPSHILTNATVVTIVFTAVGSFIISYHLFGWGLGLKFFLAVLSGLMAGLVIGFTSDYFTNNVYSPSQSIAQSNKSGPAIGILTGFSFGLLSTVIPIMAIASAVIIAFSSVGSIYGIVMADVGMLAVIGIVVAADSYGPIVDNAGGIAEMSNLPEEVREITDKLDSIGNTTKAICKGFAVGSASLTAIALFTTYTEVTKLPVLDLLKPEVIAGAFIGSGVTALFIAMTILAVSKNAFRMVEEVRRQFREIKGLLQGEAKPEYDKCVDISTKGALKELFIPGVSAIAAPILVGLILGKASLGGFLAGSTITGLVFALLMANAGGAWDNAKKYIEAGNLGGKGSELHKASVIGDTVGDPFKDTSSPSLNILIKLMSTVSLVFIPLFLLFHA